MRGALQWQLAYAAFVILWQIVGIAFRSLDLPSPGPSASPAVVVIALVLAGLFMWTAPRWPFVFVLLALISAAAGGLTLFNTFRPEVDPSLWSSPFARYLGAAINAFGVAGFGVALVAWQKSRRV